MLKLNLGSGYNDATGWVHIDKVKYHDNQIVADVLEGLPFPDNHFDFVLMNHTLQMFTYEELPVVLKEVRRVMKEGATLRILVPDLRNMVFLAMYNNEYGIENELPISDDIEPTYWGKIARYLFWHGDTRCAFTEESLISKLQESGFSNFRAGTFGDCELDSREAESLIMEAIK